MTVRSIASTRALRFLSKEEQHNPPDLFLHLYGFAEQHEMILLDSVSFGKCHAIPVNTTLEQPIKSYKI